VDLLRALAFLTILPVPQSGSSPDDIGRATAWFPIAGAVIGALLAGADAALRVVLPPVPSSALVVVLWAFLTRGFHLDGLADTFDGIGGGFDRTSRLAIMKDSRLGTFGGIAAASALLLKTAALAPLTAHSGGMRATAIFLAPILGRLAILFAMALFPSARPGGLGDMCRRRCTPGRLLAGGATAIVVAIAVAGRNGIAPLVLVALGAILVSKWIARLLGGLTGDSYGAVCEIGEILSLLSFAAMGGS
jgi:adenosylcobinamide-GDP ribazoletransferase